MGTLEKKSNAIKVYIRAKPMTQAEIEQRCINVIHNIQPRELTLKSWTNEKKYVVDRVFGENISQTDVYTTTVAPMISNIMAGYNHSILVHGQSGTGKTYTVFGESLELDLDMINVNQDPAVGLIPRISNQLFGELSRLNPKFEYTVRVSFIEVYNEEIHDLLKDYNPLRLYDDPVNKGNIYLKDMLKVSVFNVSDVCHWIKIGLNERQKNVTPLNLSFTRSHVIFMFSVSVKEMTSKGDYLIKTGQLNIVELAGSENAGRGGLVDIRPKDAATINKSIITFGNVIRALAQRMPHVPYRESKLTRILQESLSGNTKTAIIVTISPNISAWDETVGTLDLAQIAKSIVTCPQPNVSKQPANLLRELNDEISKLKQELKAARFGEGFYVSAENYEKMTQEAKDNNEKIIEMLKKLRYLEELVKTVNSQCNEVRESFEQKKAYLEMATQKLAEKQEITKKQLSELHEKNQKHKRLEKTTSELLEVCHSVIKHEEIYYRKFQDKAMSNMNNTKHTGQMVVTGVGCLKQMQSTLTENKNKREETIQEMRNTSRSYVAEYQFFLNQLKIWKETTGCFMVKYEELLKHDNFFGDHSIEDFENVSKKCCQPTAEQTENENKIDILTENLKTNVLTLMNELVEKSNKISEQLNEKIQVLTQSAAESERFFGSFKASTNKRLDTLLKQQEENEKKISYHKNQSKKAKEQALSLTEELASLDETIKQITAQIERDEEEADIEDLTKAVHEYMQMPTEVMKNHTTDIGKVMDQVDNTQGAMCNQISSDTETFKEYIRQLTETTNNNLVKINDDYKESLYEWMNLLKATENSIRRIIEIQNELHHGISTLTDSLEAELKDIGKFVNNAMEKLKILNTKIVRLGHVGDTPVKKTYSYPKKENIEKISDL